MEDKTRKLIVILEGIAIVTALVLILVDYKLKNDLVDLYKKMERALADGQKLFGPEFASDIDIASLRTGDMVGNAATVETANGSGPPIGMGQSSPAETARRTPAKRNRGNRNPPVPEPDKQMGP